MKIIEKSVAIIAAILLVLTSNIAVAVTRTKGSVATDALNLRKEASAESNVLDVIYKDTELEILEEVGEWYKVNYKDNTGYVMKEYVTKSGEVSTSKKENKEDNEKDNNNKTASKEDKTITDVSKAEVNEYKNKEASIKSDVDVYILPLVNANVIGKVKENTKVTVINVTGVWAYVKTNEIAGWVKFDKLSIQSTTNNEKKEDKPVETTENKNEKNNNEETNNNEQNNSTTQQVTDNNEQSNSATQQETPVYEAKTLYVQSSAVNVRESATTDSEIVTTLVLNTSVKAVGEESDWYKVEYDGKNGYMLKSLLGANKVEVTTRSAEVERTQSTTTTSKKTTESTTDSSKSTKSESKTSSTSSNSTKGQEVVAYAKKFLGCSYVYGGSGPSTFDCSGFTMYVFKHFGVSLPHNAATQSGYGSYVSRSNLQPGDIIIFNDYSNSYMGHVGIYVGGGNFIHASSGSGQIIITSLSNSYHNARYVTARRLV